MQNSNNLKIQTNTGFQFAAEEYIVWLSNISDKDKDLEIKNLSSMTYTSNSMLKTIYMSLVIGILGFITSIIIFIYMSLNIGLLNYITYKPFYFFVNIVYASMMAFSIKLNSGHIKREKHKLEVFNFILSKINKKI